MQIISHHNNERMTKCLYKIDKGIACMLGMNILSKLFEIN